MELLKRNRDPRSKLSLERIAEARGKSWLKPHYEIAKHSNKRTYVQMHDEYQAFMEEDKTKAKRVAAFKSKG